MRVSTRKRGKIQAPMLNCHEIMLAWLVGAIIDKLGFLVHFTSTIFKNKTILERCRYFRKTSVEVRYTPLRCSAMRAHEVTVNVETLSPSIVKGVH